MSNIWLLCIEVFGNRCDLQGQEKVRTTSPSTSAVKLSSMPICTLAEAAPPVVLHFHTAVSFWLGYAESKVQYLHPLHQGPKV